MNENSSIEEFGTPPPDPDLERGKQIAKELVRLGFEVFPCHGVHENSCTCGAAGCEGSAGKHPWTQHGHKDAVSNTADVDMAFKNKPYANVGIACGGKKGIVAIDVDPRNNGDKTIVDLGIQPLLNTASMIVDTGGGGQHYVFQIPHGVTIPKGAHIGDGIDVQADGQYIIGHGSSHKSGRTYRMRSPNWHNGEYGNLAPLPDQILGLITANARAPKPDIESSSFVAQNRNIYLTSKGGQLVRSRFSEEAVIQGLIAENNAMCLPPLSEEEVLRIGKSVLNYSDGDHDLLPQPLPERPPVMEPNPQMLPDSIRPFLLDVSERMGTALDFSMVTFMAVAGALVGRQLCIRPLCNNDWTVVPTTFGCVIGDPSTKKTPAMKKVMFYINSLEKEAFKINRLKEKEYQTELAKYKALEKAHLKTAQKAVGSPEEQDAWLRKSMPEEPKRPKSTHYVINDVTPEKAVQILQDNPNGFMQFSDELGGLFQSLTKDYQKGHRALLITAWDGDQPIQVSRISRDSDYAEATCITLFGGIQPGPFRKYLKSYQDQQGDNDGLIQRLQLAVWPDPKPFKGIIEKRPDHEAREAARVVFDKLHRIAQLNLGTVDGANVLPFLRFTREAQDLFNEAYTQIQEESRSDQLPGDLRAHIGKYGSLLPSLSLIIHLCDSSEKDVGVSAVSKALQWMKYLRSHAERIYDNDLSQGVVAAKFLLKKLQEGAFTGEFGARLIGRKGWARIPDVEIARKALVVLEEYNQITKVSPPDTRRDREKFIFNGGEIP